MFVKYFITSVQGGCNLDFPGKERRGCRKDGVTRGGGVTGDSGTRGGVQGEIMLVFAAGTWYFTREVTR